MNPHAYSRAVRALPTVDPVDLTNLQLDAIMKLQKAEVRSRHAQGEPAELQDLAKQSHMDAIALCEEYGALELDLS